MDLGQIKGNSLIYSTSEKCFPFIKCLTLFITIFYVYLSLTIKTENCSLDIEISLGRTPRNPEEY